MPSTDSKSSSPKHEPQISPAIAVDAKTGAMRDIASTPPAVPPVSPRAEPSVEYSHRTTAYGATIETTPDHTQARLTPVEGHPVEFATQVGAVTSAFGQAIQEAKRDWRERLAKDEAAKLQKRSDLIDEATAQNRKGAK